MKDDRSLAAELRAVADEFGVPFHGLDGLVRPTFPRGPNARKRAVLQWLRREDRDRMKELIAERALAAAERRAKREAREREARCSHVYFVRAGDAIKIGYAKDVRARMQEIQVGCPHRLELLHAFPGSREDEAGLHRKHRRLNIHGEWLRAVEPLLRHIERLKLRASR